MNYNSDNLGFEFVTNHKPNLKSSKNENIELSKNDKTIEYSKKILEILKAECKEHNSNNSKKVTFSQLKKVYRNSESMEKGFNEFALARVNMFLRMVNDISSFIGPSNNLSKAINNNYIISASFNPQEQDFAKAQEDIKTFGLNDLDFKNADDLYLEDEEDSVTYRLDI